MMNSEQDHLKISYSKKKIIYNNEKKQGEIQLENNPNLLNECIQLYNELLLENNLFISSSTQEKSASLEKYFLPHMKKVDQEKFFVWKEIIRMVSMNPYRDENTQKIIDTLKNNENLTSEEIAKAFVSFRKMTDELSLKMKQELETRFDDSIIRDSLQKEKIRQTYFLFQNVANEKSVKLNKKLEATFIDFLIKPNLKRNLYNKNEVVDLVKDGIILEQEIGADNAKNILFNKMVGGSTTYEKFMQAYLVKSLYKESNLNEIQQELLTTTKKMKQRFWSRYPKYEIVHFFYCEKAFQLLLKQKNLTHLEKKAYYLAYANASDLSPRGKKIIKNTLMANLNKSEKANLEKMVANNSMLPFMKQDIDLQKIVEFEEMRRGQRVATVELFTEIYEKSLSDKVQVFIQEQAILYLNQKDYQKFNEQNIQKKVRLKESQKLLEKDPLTNKMVALLMQNNLSSQEILAYQFAYMKKRNVSKETLENLINQLGPMEKVELNQLMKEKEQLLLMVEEIDPRKVSAFEDVQSTRKPATFDLFVDLYSASQSMKIRKLIEDQAALYLDLDNYLKYHMLLREKVLLREQEKTVKLIGNIHFPININQYSIEAFYERERQLNQSEQKFLELFIQKRRDFLEKLAYKVIYMKKRNVSEETLEILTESLKSDEKVALNQLMKEKEQLLLMVKDSDPKKVSAFEDVQSRRRSATVDLFVDLYGASRLPEVKKLIEEQVALRLDPVDYFAFYKWVRLQENQPILYGSYGSYLENNYSGEQTAYRTPSFEDIAMLKELPSSESLAYKLAYMEEQGISQEIQKNVKNEHDEDMAERIKEKKQLLFIAQKIGLDQVLAFEKAYFDRRRVPIQTSGNIADSYLSLTEGQIVKSLKVDEYLDFCKLLMRREKKQASTGFEYEFLELLLKKKSTFLETKAYQLAYMEVRNIPKEIQQAVIKNFPETELQEFLNLVEEKKQLLLMAKEIEPQKIWAFEEVRRGRQPATSEIFANVFIDSQSPEIKKIIEEQAALSLNPEDYLEYDELLTHKEKKAKVSEYKGQNKVADLDYPFFRSFVLDEKELVLGNLDYKLICMVKRGLPIELLKAIVEKELPSDKQINIDKINKEINQCFSILRTISSENISVFKELKEKSEVSEVELLISMYRKNKKSANKKIIEEQAAIYLTTKDYLEFYDRKERDQDLRTLYVSDKSNISNNSDNEFYQDNSHEIKKLKEAVLRLTNAGQRTLFERQVYHLAYMQERRKLDEEIEDLLLVRSEKLAKLMGEKKQLLSMIQEIELEKVIAFEKVQQGIETANVDLFIDMYNKSSSWINGEIIKKQAAQCLNPRDYLNFYKSQLNKDNPQRVFIEQILQRDISDPELSAYQLICMQKQRISEEIQELVIKDRGSHFKKLIEEKMNLLLMIEEIGLEKALAVEKVLNKEVVGNAELFVALHQASESFEFKKFIENQAAIHLDLTNYLRFYQTLTSPEKTTILGNREMEETFLKKFSALEQIAYKIALMKMQRLSEDVQREVTKDLSSAEKVQIINLVKDAEALVLMGTEIDLSKVLIFNEMRKKKRPATVDHFVAMYEQAHSSNIKNKINEQAATQLTPVNYLFFCKSQLKLNDLERSFLEALIQRQRPFIEMLAYQLVYMDKQRISEDIKKNVIEYLTSHGKKHLYDKKQLFKLVEEKKQLLLMAKEFEPQKLYEFEKALRGQKTTDVDLFVEIHSESNSHSIKKFVSEQAKLHLTERDHMIFNQKIRNTQLARDELIQFIDTINVNLLNDFEKVLEKATNYASLEKDSLLIQEFEESEDERTRFAQLSIVKNILEKRKISELPRSERDKVLSSSDHLENIVMNKQIKKELKENNISVKNKKRQKIIRSVLDMDSSIEQMRLNRIQKVFKSKRWDKIDSGLDPFLSSLQKQLDQQAVKLKNGIRWYTGRGGEPLYTGKDPLLQELFAFYKMINPSISRENFDETTQLLGEKYKIIAQQTERELLGERADLKRQLGKLYHKDPEYFAEFIQFLLLDYAGERNLKVPKPSNKELQRNEVKVRNLLYKLFPKPKVEQKTIIKETSDKSTATDKDEIGSTSNVVKEIVNLPIEKFKENIEGFLDQYKDENKKVLLDALKNRENLTMNEVVKASVLFHTYSPTLKMEKEFLDILLTPIIERKREFLQKYEEEKAYNKAKKKEASVYSKRFGKTQKQIKSDYKKAAEELHARYMLTQYNEEKELVRAGTLLQQQVKSDELTNHLIKKIIFSKEPTSIPYTKQLQQFIRELVANGYTETQREAVIQTILTPNLTLEERQKFYSFFKNDPFLQKVMEKENLSKLELKAYVYVALNKSDLPFKDRIFKKADYLLTQEEQEKFKEIMTQKKFVRFLADEMGMETALAFEDGLKEGMETKEKLFQFISSNTRSTKLKEYISQRGKNENKLINPLDDKQVLQCISGLNLEVGKRIKILQGSDLAPVKLDLIIKIKKELERNKIQYYLPEVIEAFETVEMDINNEKLAKEEKLVKETLSEIGILYTDEQFNLWEQLTKKKPVKETLSEIGILYTNEQFKLWEQLIKEKLVKEKLSEIGILYTDKQFNLWEQLASANSKEHERVTDFIVQRIANLLKSEIEQIETKLERKSIKEELLAAKEKLIEVIVKSVPAVDVKDQDLEKQMENQLLTHEEIKSLMKEAPEQGRQLIKRCKKKVYFLDVSSPERELSKIVNEWYEENKIDQMIESYMKTEEDTLPLEEAIYKLYGQEEGYCADTIRALAVDLSGVKIELNKKNRKYYGCDGGSRYNTMRWGENVVSIYEKINKCGIQRSLPKAYQNLEHTENIPPNQVIGSDSENKAPEKLPKSSATIPRSFETLRAQLTEEFPAKQIAGDPTIPSNKEKKAVFEKALF